VLIGFDQIKSQLLESYQKNKLHHAILLHGKKGIGKTSFAKELCQGILNGANSANPDLLIIEKEEGKKDINVERIRKISGFVNKTSSSGKDKFIIVDAACELNKSAANALLKTLEEPHQSNFLILVAHNLNQVLPTIISRCQITKVPDHSFEDFSKIIASQQIKFTDEEMSFLAEIFDNSPAQVVNLGAETSRFYQLFLRSILNKRLSDELIKKISDKNFSFVIFERIVEFMFSRLIKHLLVGKDKLFFEERAAFGEILQKFPAEELFTMNDEIMVTLHKKQRFYLDSKLCLINIFNRISYE
jgi:replication-associated recombination protein RarA